MKKDYRNSIATLFLLYVVGMFTSCNKHVDPPQPYGILPTQHQLDWQKMEYYMFIHFGPNTFTDVEWGNGKEDPKSFAPTNVDCRQWAATAKDAGMKAIVLTAKHHDGFCLWPSKYSTHTVRESGWKNGNGDLLKDLSEACKEYDLKFGIYLSPWDQNHPSYGTPQYNQIFANTLEEVLTNYGEIFEQWFDGANGDASHGGKKQVYDWDLFHSVVYKHQPQAIIFSDIGPGCRWMGNEKGIAGATNWSRLDIEGFEPGLGAPPQDTLNMGNTYGKAWVPAETDVSIRPGWFYSPSTDDKVKSLDQLVDIYHTSIGRNSNLILNVPPDRSGRIHPNDSVRLIEFRKAIDAIFGTNLIDQNTKIKASAVRGNSDKYSAVNLLDNDYDSYWTTDDNVTTASIEVDLESNTTFNRLLLQEYIPLGQRIAEFNVEIQDGGSWKKIADATTIGYKRILRFPSVTTNKIRINIQHSLACPVLNKIGLFSAPEKLSDPVIKRSRAGKVSLSCTSEDPAIYYTTDGSEPSTKSTLYEAPFDMANGGTVKALATVNGGKQTSRIVNASFGIATCKWVLTYPLLKESESMIDDNKQTRSYIKNTDPVIFDLGEFLTLKGFTYTPQDSESANNVYKYNFYVSNDGKKWNKVKVDGLFDNIKNNPIKQEVLFNKAVKARFIKFEATQTTQKETHYMVTELSVII